MLHSVHSVFFLFLHCDIDGDYMLVSTCLDIVGSHFTCYAEACLNIVMLTAGF